MKKIEIIDSFHQDTVHDISFNQYGQRLATCSSDRKVKIFNKVDDKWVLTSEFTAHDGPIWKVKWAHPDFGDILATCSYDKNVNIWEERKSNIMQQQTIEETYQSNWISKTKLFDSKESIEDIKFAPKHMGLMLATASVEGFIRIYVAPDIMNLASWRLESEFEASQWGINSISWNKNPFDPPMIAVASKDKSTSINKNVTNFSENSYQDSQDINIMQQQTSHANSNGNQFITKQFNQQSIPCNLNTLTSTNFKESNCHLSIYFYKDNKWNLLSYLPNQTYILQNENNEVGLYHQGPVYDISWALLNGRSYDLLASCGKDGIKVWQLKYEDSKLNIKKMEILKDESDKQITEVWRVSWNIMSTVLAASNEKNQVKLWKNFGGKYQNFITLNQDELDNIEQE